MNSLAKIYPDIIAILPAAGKGRRMHCTFPKQYSIIGNKTLLEHTVDTLLYQSCIKRIIIAINPNDQWFYKLPIANNSRINAVLGGETRANSVMSALKYVNTVSWVLTHDAVRPCLHQNDLINLVSTVTTYSSIGGILASPVNNTIKQSYNNSCYKYWKVIDHTIKRNFLWHALTPQLFNVELLKKCLTQALKDGINVTDESSAVEYCGYQPMLIPGRSDNIKVTNPEDLLLVNFYFSKLHLF